MRRVWAGVQRVGVAGFVLLLGSSACPSCNAGRPSATACDDDDDCDGKCAGGICVYAPCNDDNDCPEQFECKIRPDGSGTLGNLFLSSDSNEEGECALTCDADPCQQKDDPRWTCSSRECRYDDNSYLDHGGRYEGRAGEPIRLVGTILEVAPGKTIDEVRWELNSPRMLLGNEREVEVTLEAGRHSVTFQVMHTDGTGTNAPTDALVCGFEGATCEWQDDCCDDLFCDEGGTCSACKLLDAPCQHDGECCAVQTQDYPACDGPTGEETCTAPPVCGNDIREYAEECDGADTRECADLGDYESGPAACTSDCTVDLSSCTPS